MGLTLTLAARLAAAVLVVAPLLAQTPTQSPAQSPAPSATQTTAPSPQQPVAAAKPAAPADSGQKDEEEKVHRTAYVRRFTAGVSLTVNEPNAMKAENIDQMFTNLATPLEIKAQNSSRSTLIGFGAFFQVAVTDHFAVALAPTIRTGINFTSTVVQFLGVDNPNTVQDDRLAYNLTVSDAARYLDLPVMLRYYRKSRFERGHRWFVELGPRGRYAYQVRTNTHVIPPTGADFAYDTTTTVQHKPLIVGGTAGFGMQFIDDFGIRFVPEVRYTRFFERTFGDVTGRSRTQQVEIVFTLSF